ncbi:phosphatase PAP2 family protein [Geodermatophilus sp. YIM 151500]|uniref:phosphatase PAP2 family protein n=1 Tax=Geodermatophilus sp. YIM 151500 TaxID=2984531 RepID=UPI0021E3DE98|nr:phosphatase PAP2 family protein [Geodermatophilus sp. YIM 151500]MCV2489945.1 phosphatase PAP2 family protein [Geodermatophilus sp. YIM 151500]
MDPAAEARAARTRRRAIAVAVVAVVVVALLGAGVRADFAPQMDLDAAVSEAVYAGDDRAAFLGGLLEVLTAPGSWVFRLAVLLPVVIWLFLTRAWPSFVWVLPAVLLVGPLTTLLKEFFGRVRPDFEGGGARYESLSYPSGHSSGIATLVTVSLLLAWPYLSRAGRRWAAAGGALLVLVVGLTRMWLGVHFLSDVVGGWALGLAWSLAVALVLGGWPPHRLPPRVPFPGPPGAEVAGPPRDGPP